MEETMKRIVTVLLITALSLSLFACAAPAPAAAPAAEPAPTAEPAPSKGDLLYEKYSDILDALEKEDYDAVIEAVVAMKPVPTPVPVTSVDITMDNYLEYFDIVTRTYDRNDAYGKLSSRNRFATLQLKDQYAVDPENPGEITVGVNMERLHQTYKGMDFDFDTFTSTGKLKWKPDKSSDSVSNTSYMLYDQEQSRAYLTCDLYDEYAGLEIGYNMTSVMTVTNYEVVNITGTINLINK